VFGSPLKTPTSTLISRGQAMLPRRQHLDSMRQQE